jgi:GTP-binding protein HflX
MWTHLSKQFGGVGTKGPGETQIETDRRITRTRIGHLKEKIERFGQQRVTQRKGRTKHIRAALVGYTNVGKSTLLNLLSGSDVFVENRLFATLDPTTRLVPLSSNTEILMTDTVGFIRKLPHHLVASFKSTLEEISEADIILHVSDILSKTFQDQIMVVSDTLADLGVADKPTLMVFNKIDGLTDRSIIAATSEQFPHSVFISATRGINILGLKDEVTKLLREEFVDKTFTISQRDQKLISYLHTAGEVLDKEYSESAVTLSLRIRKKEFERVMNMVSKTK